MDNKEPNKEPTCGSCGTETNSYPCVRCGYDGQGDANFQPTKREMEPGYIAPHIFRAPNA